MLPTKSRHLQTLFYKSVILPAQINNNKIVRATVSLVQQPTRGKKSLTDKSDKRNLYQPVRVKPNFDELNVGAELTKSISKPEIFRVLNSFSQKSEVKSLAEGHGLETNLWDQAVKSFREYCLEADPLPADLHVIISDIIQGAGNETDIFPYFLEHAKQVFPHLSCLDELKLFSDLREPANWYPLARGIKRKIIFHAGPTNSGKTYHALKRFMSAKSGVYCGPLKLLATEVFNKCNSHGTHCDLITGEERQYYKGDNDPSPHMACTVEMMPLNNNCEVAVIDEIQLVKDFGRGWAWTRALLGVPANEVHLCGEAAAIELVESLCFSIGETVEVRKYKRLTELEVQHEALGSLSNIQPGDCIVCFKKSDIYTVSRSLEQLNKEVAVIYGSLPPGTKIAQAAKFNDENHPCKVLVATDAIGMGLNLHIRRIIFYSMIKPLVNNKGEIEMDTISVSAALQIAGRAGRYGTQWEKGYVTTFKSEDLPLLKNLLNQTPDTITQAGLLPTFEEIELFAFHLPNTSLSNLMDIFVSLSTVDNSRYFMCNIDDFKNLAQIIEHIPLPLRARYVFCCAPINRKLPFVVTMFQKFARQYSKNEPVTFNWLCHYIGWPLETPKTLTGLAYLEEVFDMLDLYLWLSYRFSDLFPDGQSVRNMQKELDAIIQESMLQITKLLKNSDSGSIKAALTIIEGNDHGGNMQRNNYSREPYTNDSFDNKTKLSERLLTQGILTPSMLQELKREWTQKVKLEDDRRPLRRKFTRKPK